ncbi:hypothetical protein AB6802_09795 [Mesorhizobium sp. RCC_202]|uniref:hypothetical protein n=1 Tax=Mesorhizobium sp. RCC_202 TaxID=3239222 RepID=UPI00352318B1
MTEVDLLAGRAAKMADAAHLFEIEASLGTGLSFAMVEPFVAVLRHKTMQSLTAGVSAPPRRIR